LTLPSNIIFPLRADFNELEDIDRYIRDLTFELQRMYEQIANGVNGDIRGSAFTQRENWTPILQGATTSGTFTYDHQIGWAFRQGIITDIWFDVQWSAAGSAAGNLYLILPYKVANTAQMPFSNDIQTSNIAYGAGQTVLSINAIPNTFRGEIWSSGSGNATANIAVVASGRLIGSLRYIGVQNETP
jgi:hypothetical protein